MLCWVFEPNSAEQFFQALHTILNIFLRIILKNHDNRVSKQIVNDMVENALCDSLARSELRLYSYYS